MPSYTPNTYIASAYRAKIDCTVTNISDTQSKVTVALYLEINSGAKDGAWNFKGRAAIGADSSWPAYTQGSNSYLTGPTTVYICSANRTYNRITSSQTVTCYGQITNTYNSGWAGPSYPSGPVTIPALPSYTISYDANGGSGAPDAQTKYHGTDISLSSTVPTRANYNFLGWADSAAKASAGTVDYSAGATYSGNGNAVLYAVWALSYLPPQFSLKAYRTDSNGDSSAATTDCLTFEVDWHLQDVQGATAQTSPTSLVFSWSENNSTTGVASSRTATISSFSDISDKHDVTGKKYTYAPSSGCEYSNDLSYAVSAVFTDEHGLTASANVTVPSLFALMSFGYEGKSIAFGKLASQTQSIIEFGSNLTPVMEDAVAWRYALGGNSSGVWTTGMIPNHSAAKLTSGTLPIARIRNVAWTYIFGSENASNYARWSSFGRTVIVQVNIASGTNITSTAVHLGTVSNSTYLPDKTISAPLYHSSNNTGCLWINNDGKVYVNTMASSTQTTAYGVLVYRAAG